MPVRSASDHDTQVSLDLPDRSSSNTLAPVGNIDNTRIAQRRDREENPAAALLKWRSSALAGRGMAQAEAAFFRTASVTTLSSSRLRTEGMRLSLSTP